MQELGSEKPSNVQRTTDVGDTAKLPLFKYIRRYRGTVCPVKGEGSHCTFLWGAVKHQYGDSVISECCHVWDDSANTSWAPHIVVASHYENLLGLSKKDIYNNVSMQQNNGAGCGWPDAPPNMASLYSRKDYNLKNEGLKWRSGPVIDMQ